MAAFCSAAPQRPLRFRPRPCQPRLLGSRLAGLVFRTSGTLRPVAATFVMTTVMGISCASAFIAAIRAIREGSWPATSTTQGLGCIRRLPYRGYRKINVLCAQDDSIWDRDQRVEYTYGWSENYGKGDDGLTLESQRGRVIESGPDAVVLQCENAGGCFRVTKVATTRKEASWWILATRIANRCDHPVHFDHFTGDDPWIGLYQSSEDQAAGPRIHCQPFSGSAERR
jgi:hypothetical protein